MRRLGFLGLLLLPSACAAPAPTTQTLLVAVEPGDAECLLRQGATIFPLAAPERRVSVPVAGEIEVECRRAGYETTIVHKSPLQYSSAPNAGPLLLLLDPGTFKRDSYPPVVRVTMERL